MSFSRTAFPPYLFCEHAFLQNRFPPKCNLRLLDVETGFMYKKVSFRSGSKPGRMIAPGFVLCGRMIGQTGGSPDLPSPQVVLGVGEFATWPNEPEGPIHRVPFLPKRTRGTHEPPTLLRGEALPRPLPGERSASPYEDLGVSCRNTAATSPRRKAGPLAAARLSSAAAIASGGRRLAQNNGPPF